MTFKNEHEFGNLIEALLRHIFGENNVQRDVRSKHSPYRYDLIVNNQYLIEIKLFRTEKLPLHLIERAILQVQKYAEIEENLSPVLIVSSLIPENIMSNMKERHQDVSIIDAKGLYNLALNSGFNGISQFFFNNLPLIG